MAGKNLVIVESPAKVKTIKKYLGSGYTVDASMGHVRDLPKSRLGIDVENDFEPDYITIRGKGDLLSRLRKESKAADKIYLATDPDREGEAISWHLIAALKLDPAKKVYRISFNEITKKAISEAMKSPREIDMDLVDAQQARRVLDRVVGYRISPLLWAKIKRGLSAGRVQSAALRMICDREEEIASFIPQEYWTMEASLSGCGLKKPITASWYGTENEKIELKCEEDVNKVKEDLKGKRFTVKEVASSQRFRKPPLPFTTSTLQQEAGRMLNFPTAKTMKLAQQLYEGVDAGEFGNIALITYLRTDSTRISDEADKACREYIEKNLGSQYCAGAQAQMRTSGRVQDAHEAIRPVDINIIPAKVKDSLPRDLYRLYQLIWKRFAASRMKPAVYDTENIRIAAGKYIFTASGSRLVFDGYLSIYTTDEDKTRTSGIIGSLKTGDVLKKDKLDAEKHLTLAPPHYTESALVKAMEDNGIGRPSTYAPTISTILARHYVTKEQKNIYVTELGQVVNNMMKEQFPEIVDRQFTADMENRLDEVAEGNLPWKKIIEDYYPRLDAEVIKAEKELSQVSVQDEETDVICENCGRNMVIKYGPHGKFLACPGFPECKNTRPFLEKIDVRCPLCGMEVVRKKSRKGRIFYGCENSPECGFVSWAKPVNDRCPKCGAYMVDKGTNLVCSSAECGYKTAK